jgi:SAM-dependent methyltransferase
MAADAPTRPKRRQGCERREFTLLLAAMPTWKKSMFLRDDHDSSWERYGREEPYYGVLSGERYRIRNLTESAKRDFFASGEKSAGRMLDTACRRLGDPADWETALDFGCGVGRVLVPLAQRFRRVTGVDVSPSMLAEAQKNCVERGLVNVEFVRSDDDLSGLRGSFSLVHSQIVLQHIPVARGERIIARLLLLLKPGGIAALHVPFLRRSSRFRRGVAALRKRVALLNIPINLAQGKAWDEPLMQMNYYDLDRLLALFHAQGISGCFIETAESEGCLSAFIFLKRAS